MKQRRQFAKAVRRKAKKGFRGYPVGTVALYGPDDRHATKLTVGIIADESDEVVDPPKIGASHLFESLQSSRERVSNSLADRLHAIAGQALSTVESVIGDGDVSAVLAVLKGSELLDGRWPIQSESAASLCLTDSFQLLAEERLGRRSPDS